MLKRCNYIRIKQKPSFNGEDHVTAVYSDQLLGAAHSYTCYLITIRYKWPEQNGWVKTCFMHCFNVSLSLISQTFFSTKMHSIEDAKLQNISFLNYKEGKLRSTGKHLLISTEKHFYSRVKQEYICTWMPKISESIPTFILAILPSYVHPQWNTEVHSFSENENLTFGDSIIS